MPGKKSRIAKYIDCIEITKLVDYGKMKTVRNSNKAVDKLRALVAEIWSSNEIGEIQELVSLLEHPDSSYRSWTAYSILDLCKTDSITEAKCLSIISEIAKGDSWDINASGARSWLNEWPKKKATKESHH